MHKSYLMLSTLLIILIIGAVKVFPQDSVNVKQYEAYKKDVNLLYSEILQNKISKQQAELKFDSLKNSTYSSRKEFYELVHKTLGALIVKLKKEKVDTVRFYVVKEGDYLSKIAEKKYSSISKWPVIYTANKTEIKNPDFIFPGQKLILPILNQTIKIGESFQQKIDTTLPQKSQVSSNNKTELHNSENEDAGISGLVVDETFSKIGHDFYALFYSNWESPKNVKDYTITISEKPLPQLGAQITIIVNDTSVYQRFVQPRSDIIEEMAQQGLEISYSYLENYDQIQKELRGQDMQGTGIF